LDEVAGIEHAMKAMRFPKDRQIEATFADDLKLAGKLIHAGNDHAKAMRGIVAYVEIHMQVGFMIEFETYRHGIECLSTSSSMHNELAQLTGADLASQKQKDLVVKVYRREVMISYQALRSMYIARRKHKHPDWQIFCDFIELLPYFNSLIMPKK
jgi:hypothetical protein